MASSKLSSEFSELKFVGEGAFGKVYRGKEKSSGKICALKVLAGSISANQREIDALQQIPAHENIVKYIRLFFTENQELCLVMEYCSGGTLNKYLVSHRELEPSRDLRFMRQIASAVAFLHRFGVAHRDLKPDNILLSDNGTLKVADFGLAKIITDSKGGGNLLGYYMGTKCGTPYFTAPEVRSGHYTVKSDVFSMGVIFACILQRTVISTARDGDKAVALLSTKPIGEALCLDPSTKFLLPKDLNISQEIRTLVERMLECSPSDRPAADGVKSKLGA
ncbi:serine/threonine-protein kinase pdik1l-B-like [Asterias rubens]|uniref:serine/threonine-protein kinase pdik1l-B-like n=1 Tax=Asterias rubens TaxID=7604 RepID=UPI001455AB3C|nr:serine/threonine-protein kinase pdik1l-B-like [Asterias rubens]XP_033644730.1 serine/threonine-protein kinase pdik1l-B-like [Asterias rubens]